MKSYRSYPLFRDGLLILGLGWTVYGIFRSTSYPLIPQWDLGESVHQFLPLVVTGSLATLSHVWGMALLTAAAMPRLCFRQKWLAPSLWLIINLLFEFGQKVDKASGFFEGWPQPLARYFLLGRFDWMDVAAAILGAMLAGVSLYRLSMAHHGEQRRGHSLSALLVLLFGCSGILASYSNHHIDEHLRVEQSVVPIYMPYEEFRDSFAVLPAEPIQNPGKIYVMNKLLLISDSERGVHIVDNSDPKAPKPIKFLKIIGNHDIAVRGHVLYVDSYVDMLTIDLIDIQSPSLLQRITDIFPWTAPSAPGRVWIDEDPDKGVIIGFENKSSSTENNP